MPIHKKILAVMKDVDYLIKDGKIEYGKTRYKGLREEIVTTRVRDSMVEHDLIVFPVHQIHTREGNLTTVDVTYRFVDTEDDSFLEAVSSGTGVDTQDKGVGMAMTYAYKYLFLRTFAIPTGEDPDRISSAELDDKDAKRKTTKPENGATTAQVEKVTKERADKAWRHMKQMMVDYENVMPIAELNSIQEEMGQVKTIEDAMKLYGRFKAATRRFEIESGKDKEGFQYE